MSSKYFIIIGIGERHKNYVCHIFRALLSYPNPTFNRFIESTEDNWDTGTEVPTGELINNATVKYNTTATGK